MTGGRRARREYPGYRTALGDFLAPKTQTGRTSMTFSTTYNMISSQIQMLALATETRQYTTLRLPTSQWGLPVVTITALTLLGRTAQTLLTFSLQDKVISVAPLLSMQRISKCRVSTYVQMWAQEENSVLKLAANPAT
ncbi:hypothetical protein EV177_003704, partial [Coemansia sp. RSA 1804]